ncbi:sulfotransferase domain-containing protein [Candidatus Pelagibacter bacterium nBUS_25]|uniref:sulfotransferase domain-containing protein n=1 Tax=Candidatus Pelagibacter bacterium nBUS_25 TaxID=3374187 RepID=UPI003EB9FC38
MIFWISSYPKSGNTWLRILLASYYYTKDGVFDENVLKYIDQFPQKKFFNGFSYDPKISTDTTKFWIKAQEKINQDKKIRFFKTHNVFGSVNNFNFTNRENSIGCVYVVRDPRNVITSLKNFYEMNDDQAFKFVTSKSQYIYDLHKFSENGYSDFQFISSWDSNLESWKSQKRIPVKVIRYEDLLNQTYTVVNDVISFINQTIGSKEKIFKNKIKNAVSSSSFSKLKDKEKSHGFLEAPRSKIGDSKIPFFNLGPKNNWKTILNDDLKYKLNKVFKKKLEELSYE